MAKRRTGKRSVKRAFKKRRTIRKFRKTMRRYLQSGGINPAITMIVGLALAFVLENDGFIITSWYGRDAPKRRNYDEGRGFWY